MSVEVSPASVQNVSAIFAAAAVVVPVASADFPAGELVQYC